MSAKFDELIRNGRDTDAMRFLAQEYYDNGKMGHTRKLLLERVADNLDESQRKEQAAEYMSSLRKSIPLTPIYTSGGHGHYDDDDEDFWCPICHAHLGTHRGYQTTCQRCGQSINPDSEPCYEYKDMRNSEKQWRGHQNDEENVGRVPRDGGRA